MSNFQSLRAGTLALAIAAIAAAPAVADTTAASGNGAAQQDFTKLSTAGAQAFDDVALARLAIFDGHPARAATLIEAAVTAFDRAAVDHTAFAKAENALNPPTSLRRPPTDGVTPGTPTTWIPVGEGFAVSETLAPAKATASALETANHSLKAGEQPGAVQKLKVAKVSAVATVALAPLQASQDDLHRASQLANASDYYGASQALRALEDGVRYDVIDATGKPAPAAQTANAQSGDHTHP
jgi:hypothetical protein